MLYELHITVQEQERNDEWQDFCTREGIKPLLIELVHPEVANNLQLMFAARHEGTDDTAAEWHYDLTQTVQFEGFTIDRSKLEVPLDYAAPYRTWSYHETHVKALLTKDEEDFTIPTARELGWAVSRNLYKRDDAGLSKWYFTKRDYDYDFRTAANEFTRHFTNLSDTLLPAPDGVVRMEMETVLHDSNPELDRGWAL